MIQTRLQIGLIARYPRMEVRMSKFVLVDLEEGKAYEVQAKTESEAFQKTLHLQSLRDAEDFIVVPVIMEVQ